MSCRCEQKKLSSELDRIRRLAKIAARLDGETYAIYGTGGGTYGFAPVGEAQGKDITEYISKY